MPLPSACWSSRRRCRRPRSSASATCPAPAELALTHQLVRSHTDCSCCASTTIGVRPPSGHCRAGSHTNLGADTPTAVKLQSLCEHLSWCVTAWSRSPRASAPGRGLQLPGELGPRPPGLVLLAHHRDRQGPV